MNYGEFIKEVGAIAMGATTYAWILAHLAETGESWSYDMPAYVFTHREPDPPRGRRRPLRQRRRAPRRTTRSRPRPVSSDVWVVGGGDLAAQFAEAGHLDEMIVSIAPVTLGAGRPLFPRRWDFRLVELDRNRAFACARYEVVGPLGP